MSILATPEYVSSGSRMVWTGQFSGVPLSVGPSDLIAAVASTLANNYQLVVEKSDNNYSALTSSPTSITLYLRTDIDRGDGETDDGLTDILNNVNDAFKTNIGALSLYNPTLMSSSINSYTPAPTQDNPAPVMQTTGTPLQTTAQVVASQPASTNWWDSLTTKLEAGSVGFLVGGAVVVGLVIYMMVRPQVSVA